MKPQKVLEIGVKHGGTLWNWMQYAAPGATIVALDDCKQVDVSDLSYRWTVGIDIDFHFVVGDSHNYEIIELVNEFGPFDFVFIDGDHTYEGVKKDWENFGNANVVAFHDIVPHLKKEDNGASELWQEIKQYHTTQEIVNHWDSNFGGIGVVYMLY